MGIALIALVALGAVIWMTYIVGTEMRARAKGWKTAELDHDYGIDRLLLYKWLPEQKRWTPDGAVWKIRKVTTRDFPQQTHYYAGCFGGTYEEAIQRLESKARTPLAHQWYLDQLRKASLS